MGQWAILILHFTLENFQLSWAPRRWGSVTARFVKKKGNNGQTLEREVRVIWEGVGGGWGGEKDGERQWVAGRGESGAAIVDPSRVRASSTRQRPKNNSSKMKNNKEQHLEKAQVKLTDDMLRIWKGMKDSGQDKPALKGSWKTTLTT